MSENIRRYAVPTANGEMCLHFGHCDQFALIDVDVENCKIVDIQMKTPPPHEPGVLPRWLHEEGAHVILSGGMGERAQNLFTENSIEMVTGVSVGKPEDIVLAYVKGELVTGSNVCDH